MVRRRGLGTGWKRMRSVEVFSANSNWGPSSVLQFSRDEVGHCLLAVCAVLHPQSVDSQVSAPAVLLQPVVVGFGLLQLELELVCPCLLFAQLQKKR